MSFYISRQRDFKSNTLIVEIACGGPKKASPDILTARYKGEQKNLVDPRDAINVAERIYKLWDRDYFDEKKFLRIIVDSKTNYLSDFSSKSLATARAWANKIYAILDKCGNCNKAIGISPPFEVDDISKKLFCPKMFGAKKYREIYGKEPPRVFSPKDKRQL